MGQIQSFEELLDLVLRRRLLILAVALFGIISVGLMAKSRPDTFEAVAVIQIQVPSISGTDGTPAQSGAAQMLQAIEQRLTTRENLLEVIARHGLFANTPGVTDNERVNMLRGSLRFENVASAAGQSFGGAPQLSALLVFERLDDPDQAARVANDFAQSILDQSSAGQLDRARETAEFFTSEEARVWTAITDVEAEMAAFKNANASALPTQRDALRDARSALEDDLRAFEQDLVALEGERRTIAAKGSLRATDQRTLQDLDAQGAVLAEQRAALLLQRAEIDSVLSQTPEVERVLSGFERQLEQLQQQYEVINRRMAEAETAQRLAERQQAERFTLLERAVTPQHSMGGGGTKIMIAGAIASIVGAIGLAFLVDLFNPVVRTAEQMERQLDLSPVISIPEVSVAARSKRRGHTLMRMLDDPKRPILGVPRYAVVAGGATLCLVLAAAVIS